jgi:hypothetical protein
VFDKRVFGEKEFLDRKEVKNRRKSDNYVISSFRIFAVHPKSWYGYNVKKQFKIFNIKAE